uniref:Transmembrane protein n=1 Tax=Trichogramma kaykai TaxID=54128 RepID=A0ABD2XLZ9_9HYME
MSHLRENMTFRALKHKTSETREVSGGHAYTQCITAYATRKVFARRAYRRLKNGALGRRRQPYIVRPCFNKRLEQNERRHTHTHTPRASSFFGRNSSSSSSRCDLTTFTPTHWLLLLLLLLLLSSSFLSFFALLLHARIREFCIAAATAAQRGSPEIDSSKQHTTERARNSKQNEKKGTNVSIRWPRVCTTTTYVQPVAFCAAAETNIACVSWPEEDNDYSCRNLATDYKNQSRKHFPLRA